MSRTYDFSIQKKRLIDADELKKLLFDVLDGIKRNPKMDGYELCVVASCVTLCDMIDDAPTIDPESLRPVGKWVNASGGRTICKRCGNYPLYDHWDKLKLSRFCPKCGARMENGKED